MTISDSSNQNQQFSFRPRLRLNRRKVGGGLLTLVTILILFFFALPAFWIVFTAFRPGNEINVSPPIWIPRRLTLDVFGNLFGLNPDYATKIPVMNYLRKACERYGELRPLRKLLDRCDPVETQTGFTF